MHTFIRKFLLVVLVTVSSISISFCKDPVEEKCTHACDFFVKCTEKVQNMKIEGELLKQGTIQCIDGCTRFQSQILSCYDAESNSCNGMAECMKQSGLDE